MYDVGVYGIWNPRVWQCPTEHITAFYRDNVREIHLEAGCGTGYLPAHCGRSEAWRRAAAQGRPALTLLDFSPSSLAWSARRLREYQPRTLRHNLFEPLPAVERPFESICLNYVLHCLPGDFDAKQVVVGNLKSSLAPGGLLFGSTILGHVETPSQLGRRMLDLYNFIGSFHNAADRREDLERVLRSQFTCVECHVVGAVALFKASDAPLLQKAG